ncbi:MAG: ABC transporter permease [Solirubrobacterales bacterium]
MSALWKWLRYHAVSIWAALAIAYLLVPIALIAVFSFNNPSGKFNYTWEGFSTDAWTNIFGVEELTDAFLTSLRLAALATVVATILGTMIALALVRHHFHGRRVANFLIVIPMATPEVVIGASLLSMFLIYGISLGFFSLFLAHVMFSISFVVIVVRSRLIGFDRRLEEAARDLGATPLTTFRTVTLPLLTPGLIGAGLLAFSLSIDDFVISNFTSGTTVTFPLYIFGAAQRGIPVEVYSVATLLFAVTVLAMVFVTWQQKRAEKMAEIRPDDTDESGLSAIASGKEPIGAGSTA